jgi:putative restriction endonuclease
MFTLAVTTLRWHEYFLSNPPEGLVNFWTPTLWRPRIEAGSRFFFLLKSPVRKIGGFGNFVRWEEHSVDAAWSLYGKGNGVEHPDRLRGFVDGYAARRAKSARDENCPIGCIILRDCVFLSEAEQIAPDELGLDFASSIVKFKRYSGYSPALPFEMEEDPSPFCIVHEDTATTGSRDVKLRPQQTLFRARILAAYQHRCAVFGTPIPETLDAAHIQPFRGPKSNHVQNGLALRKDVHALFDAGYFAISDDYRLLVSERVTTPSYRALAGRRIRLPCARADHPSLDAIRWHRAQFRGPAILVDT